MIHKTRYLFGLCKHLERKLLTQMCWHTANDAVGRQIDAVGWIICLYGGNIVLILMVYSTFARSREVHKLH